MANSPYDLRVIKRPPRPQGVLYICTEQYYVVVWRAVPNEFNIVDALLIWSTVSSGIRMPSHRSGLSASPAETPATRTSMGQK